MGHKNKESSEIIKTYEKLLRKGYKHDNELEVYWKLVRNVISRLKNPLKNSNHVTESSIRAEYFSLCLYMKFRVRVHVS